MSAHNEQDHEDNYERAYGSDAEPVQPAAPTPEHGYWRSLRELDGKAPFQTTANHEFPPAAEVTDPLSRRNFFHLMGASMALAGVAGCKRYEKEEIVPLARRPEDQVPGTTQKYATAFDLGGVGHALLATSFEGRPIKLDGNPEHPFASGGTVPAPTGTSSHAGCSTFAQASILHLYDPDRSQGPLSKGAGTSLETVRAALAEVRKNLTGVRVLSEASSSPTMQALKRQLASKGVGWHEYEALSWDNERLGTQKAFNRPVRPLARLDRAETIVTIDCDLFVEHPAAMRYSRDFARSRRLHGSLGINKMNRLWSIESTYTNTGAMADHRLPLRSEFGLPVAMYLDRALGGTSTVSAKVLDDAKVKRYLDVLVGELKQNVGKSIVIAGRRQPPEVHALVARINEKLGAPGTTLDYIEDPEPDRPSHLASITSLARDMAAGKVQTLIIVGGNPVYDAPADLDFAAALGNVKTSLHLHEYVNETSQKSTWHVPRAHFLEAWGDARTWDGTITIAQPLIAPLYGGISNIELLSLLSGEERTGEVLVRDQLTALNLGANWRQNVHDGFVANDKPPIAQGLTVQPLPNPTLTPSQGGSSAPEGGSVEVTFHYSSFSYDGRFANNAWLQETPDFLTKVTWDNYALVGPETATALGLDNDSMIKVKIGEREVELPCYTIPGQARFSISLVLGGGRTAAGRVGGQGDRTVGWNTNKVRTTAGFDIATNAKVTSVGKSYELASVQEHWDIRTGIKPEVNLDGIQERLPELIHEVTGATLVKDKAWRAEAGPEIYWDDANVAPAGEQRGLSLFKEQVYKGHRWGMAIDLSTCTGCNSCQVACQAENNIPVVGRKEIINNREMSWIRIDRYYRGRGEDAVVVHQPVACQQCENAPCEQVCPVGATSHSDEGLNDMAYNRCIGTRYCANNCPYKVRRFNFLDWNKEWREARNKVRRLLFNPEVTVRMRGVMEKCTFCVQRIEAAKIHARAERRNEHPGTVDAPMPDGTVQTACQAACPTEAIMFGDLSDPNSRVSRAHGDQRQYALLPETYTKPRNRFLARVRNPNPTLVPPAAAPSHGGH
ncbi:MAG: molybdopterin oxidoreductase, iron-sulfur binding subunit [Deltaproteobacteria bacterium]|nr:molybdopterin oxidoreductase, iron-sulfur binding subunit [Deltaproteobacteria bacterium]